jgi:hypothetical protein
MTPEEQKKHLMAQAEAIINTLVEQPGQTLSEIEAAVVKAGQEMKAAMLSEVVAGIAETLGEHTCPTCGGKVSDKGIREKWVVTQAGEVRLERHYYYCDRCKAGFFPSG